MKRLLFILMTLCLMYGGVANAALPRFIDLYDGTVFDTVSKLRWLKNANCFGEQNWDAAVSSGANLASGSCGLTDGSVVGDWHLPTVEELRIFTDAGYRDTTLNAAGFNGVQANWFWSSSTYAYGTGNAWLVGMVGGYVFNDGKRYGNYVWPVRSGQFDYLVSFGSLMFHQSNQLPQNVNLGGHAVTEILIINGGEAASSFSTEITGIHSAEFSVAPGGASPCSSLSPTLAAGTSCSLQVTVTPTTTGAKTANVSISSSSITTPTGKLSIPLSVTGVTTIVGTLYDLSTGTPLAGATVAITGGTTTQTDPQGNFIFDPKPANGVYTVTITKTGYATATYNNVIVSDTAGATLTLGMAPSGILNFTTASGPLYHAETGTAYNQSARITGGAGPYTFAKAYGTLPPGLTVDTALGSINGTPTTVGSYTFAVGVTDQLGSYAEREFSIEVTAPLAVAGATLPRGTDHSAYSSSVAASGGKSPYSYSVTAGSLPAGLSLDAATGKLFGTTSPVAVPNVLDSFIRSFAFNIQATDASGRTATQSFTIAVDAALYHKTTRLNDGIVGSVFNQTLTAAGGLTPYTWSVYSGTLPAGLTLNATNGIISGTPTSATTQPVVIAVQDSYNRVVYKQFTINVLKPLQILTAAMPNGLVNNTYSEAIRTNGGIGPYSFALTGQLPAGLTLNATTGVVSGTPTATGLTNLQVTVTDSSYPTPQTKTQNLSVRVTSSVTITTSAVLSNAKKGTAITPITLVAKGGLPGYTWAIISGDLPSGITLDPATGIISGTPSERGDFAVTIRVTDSIGNATGPANAPPNPDKQFILHISDTLSVTTGAVPNGAKGLPYSATLSATGGLKNYSWAVKTGTLPSGLSLSSDGTISGTPLANITSNVTFEVTDSDAPAQKATVTLIFVITDTLSIYEGSIPNSRINQAYTTNVRAQLGTPPYSWSISSGTLPAGVTLTQNAGTAVLSGTPTAAGSSSFTLQVSDNGTPVQTVSRDFTTIVYPDVVISTAGLNTAIRNTPYSDTVAASGGLLPYTYTITAGTLPSGLAFNSTTGAVSGSVTMATGASATFTVTVTDSGYPSASVSKEFTIMAIDPLVINTLVIQGALQKSSYTTTFDGQGGVAPLTWSLVSGSFPASMTIAPQTGVLSGTTPVCGTFNFTLQLADSATVPTTTQKAYQLAVTCSNDYDLRGNVGVAGVAVALSGTLQKSATSDASGNFLFQHLTNGNYTITPTKTGYWFTPDTKSVTINNLDMSGASLVAAADNTPPTGSIAINSGSAYTKAVAIVLGLNSADVGSGVVTQMQFSSDTGATWATAENYTQSRNMTLSTGDGSKTVSVKFKDKAGNWSSVYIATITLDTVPPDTSIATKPANPSNTAAPSFTFTSTETNSPFECRLDGGAFAACTSAKAYAGLTEGNHTLEVRATDPAGNTDATPTSYTWAIDLTPPGAAIVAKPANPSNQKAGSITFNSADVTATFECKIDAGSFAACATPFAYSSLADGSHTFTVRAKDPAGNVTTTPASYTWVVDTLVPDSNISAKPANPSNSVAPSFTFTSTEANSTFECRLDNGTFAACISPKAYSNLTAGSHTFEMRTTDPTGNTDQTPAAYTWTIDLTPPDTSITTKPANPSNNSAPSFVFTSTEANSTFECRLDNGTFATCTSPKAYSGLTEVSHTFEVRATDPAGSTDATPASYTWMMDLTPPFATISGKPVNPTNNPSATFNFSSNDAADTLECQLDTGSFAACSSPYGYINLTEGSHTFQVRAKDAAGNTNTASYTWLIYLTPPVTSIDSKPAALTGSSTASFGFSSSVTGSTFECRLDGGSFATCISPKIYSSLPIGNHTFEVRATDPAGNMDATPATYSWERSPVLTVSFAGTGGGSVNSNPAGITCVSGSSTGCSAPFAVASGVTLMPTVDAESLFKGWDGACSNLTGNCSVTMDTAKVVTAIFDKAPLVKLTGTTPNYYGLILSALEAASAASTVQVQARTFTETLLFNRPISVFIKGGYDPEFTVPTGKTKVKGKLLIRQGTVRVDGLVVY